nr:TetR/AcrR family transcriptional regulator [Acidimicrobiia bacterium]
ARFHNVRTRLLNGVTVALREVIGQRSAGRAGDGIDPMATAGVLVAMVAHVSAHRYGFEFWGIRTEDVRRSMAGMVFWSVSGQRPPT